MRAMKLLRDRDYADEIFMSIGRAKKEITIRVFLIDPGREKKNPVLRLLDALARARKRGVAVRLHTDNIFRSRASGKRLAEVGRRLGLKIHWDEPVTILHEKTVAIDGRLLFLGSHNWTASSLKENHELSLKLRPRPPRLEGSILSMRSSSRDRLPAKVLLDASGFAKQLIDDIDRAQKEILIASFDIDESSSPYEFGTKITEALIRAQSRGRKVRVLLDASQMRVPETGEILYHLRGLKKADDLVRRGVSVYYDTTLRLFHAKASVIDGRIVYTGSQNLEMRKDVTALEATARLVSKPLARQVTQYLESILRSAAPYFYEPSSLLGIPIPLSFLSREGVLSRIYSHHGVKTFRFYLKLLQTAWRTNSNRIQKTFPESLKDDRRRLIGRYQALEYVPGTSAQASVLTLLDPANGNPFRFPHENYFILPDGFFEYGWFERLGMRDMFVYFIHLAESQNSVQSPYWSRRTSDIARRYGIDTSNLSHATVRLERWNLIDVIRDPKITVKNGVKKPNRYRLNPLWDPKEHELIKRKMLEEFGLTPVIARSGATKQSRRPDMLKEAERLAALLNQDHDLEVIRKFLLLMDRYGLDDTKKAARLTARFKHQFALRTVSHTAAILRNWSLGIRK